MPITIRPRHGLGPLVRPVIALLPLWLSMPAPGRAQAPPAIVYVESNIGHVEGMNSILAYLRDGTGQLTQVGMFATGGTGVHPTATLTPADLGPFDSDQNMVLAPGNTRLFAVNSGSDTIAVFDIMPGGALVHVPGSPFPSGGVNPVSVGLSGNTLVVVNKDYDLGRPGFNALARRPNYRTFRVAASGALVPVAGSTILADPDGGAGPGNSVPTQALVSPDGSVVFDADFFGFHLHSFRLRANGRLLRADSEPIPPAESPVPPNPFGLPIPLGLQVHPTEPVLYVGYVLDQKFGVYEYGRSTGQVEFLRSVTGAGNALVGVCWFVTNAEGTRLYTANNFNNTVTVLSIADPRHPVELQTVPLSQGLGDTASPFQIALDPDGAYLHVVTQRGTDAQGSATANSLQSLRVEADGTLTLIDTEILDTFPSRPQGVAAIRAAGPG